MVQFQDIGLIAYGSSLDQIGPMAKDVSDCAALLELWHRTTKKTPHPLSGIRSNYFTLALVDVCAVKGMKIGIPERLFRGRTGL